MLAPTPKPIAEAVEQEENQEVLDRIYSPGCAVAIWHRRLPFQDWIDALTPDALPETRLTFDVDQADSEIASVLAGSIADCSNRQELARDIVLLARSFARIMDIARVRLRLDVLTDDACRRFHLDNVAARVLCTYRGRGTEFGRALTGREPQVVENLSTGSVGLFRGALWPGPERSCILHRSPPIAGRGETRLLLVIDPPGADD